MIAMLLSHSLQTSTIHLDVDITITVAASFACVKKNVRVLQKGFATNGFIDNLKQSNQRISLQWSINF